MSDDYFLEHFINALIILLLCIEKIGILRSYSWLD